MSAPPPRALVTGASGFVGSHLVETLIERGWPTRCLVRRSSNLRWLSAESCELFVAGFDDGAALETAADGVDVVFHLAALTTATSPDEYRHVNVEGTRRVIESVRAASPDALIVFCSSLAAAGPARDRRPLTELDPPRPVGPYGESKLEAELLVGRSGLRHVIVRPPAVYGPRDRDILAAFRLASRGLAPRVGPANQRLSLVHARDLAQALLAAAQRGREGGVYFVTDGAIHTWREVTHEIASAVGRSGVLAVPVPPALATAAAHGMRLWARVSGSRPLLTPERARDLAQEAWICDDSRARRELGYESRIPLPQGIQETAAWYREHGCL